MSAGGMGAGPAAGRTGGPGLAAHVDPCLKYGSLEGLQVDKRIGKGQFSEVFRAFSRYDGTPVALKKVQVRVGVGGRPPVAAGHPRPPACWPDFFTVVNCALILSSMILFLLTTALLLIELIRGAVFARM